MTRKIKILVAVVVVVAIAILSALWPAQKEPDIEITFERFSPNNFSQVWFKIANTSTNVVVFTSSAEELRAEQWQAAGFSRMARQTLAPRGTTKEFVMVTNTNRWRFCVTHSIAGPGSIIFRARNNIGLFMQKHHLVRLGQSIMPKILWQTDYGPEMLGNQPAPEQGDRK